MKKLLFSSLLVGFVLSVSAQSDVLAVTGQNSKMILNKDLSFISAENGKSHQTLISFEKETELPQSVAAMALDKQNQRVIFMDMNSLNIFTHDLKSGKIQQIHSGEIAKGSCSQDMQFARMTQASDGNIYAINNNASIVLQIQPQKGGYYVVNDLGALVDADSNSQKSLLDQRVGWGGDLIADSEGNLYLISAMAHVFKVDLQKLEATYLGQIKGLPANYTTNGAAVMSNGKVLLGNAQGSGLFEVDIHQLSASQLSTQSQPMYDLASAYLIKEVRPTIEESPKMALYPTKINQHEIKVSRLDNKMKGMGQFLLIDIVGNVVMDEKIALNNVESTFNVLVKPGNYIVKILDETGNEVHQEKVIVTR